jgi:hypothetical protein
MWLKNTANQQIGFVMIKVEDGTLVPGATISATVRLGISSPAAVTGTVVDNGDGSYTLDMSAADSNGDFGSFVFEADGCYAVEKTIAFFDSGSFAPGVTAEQLPSGPVLPLTNDLQFNSDSGLFLSNPAGHTASVSLSAAGLTQAGGVSVGSQTIAGPKTIRVDGIGTATSGLVLDNENPGTALAPAQNGPTLQQIGQLWDFTSSANMACVGNIVMSPVPGSSPPSFAWLFNAKVGSSPAALAAALFSTGLFSPAAYGLQGVHTDGDTLIWSNIAGHFATGNPSTAIPAGGLSFSQIAGWPLPVNLGGTGADLSGTGPGVLVQGAGGSSVTIVSPGADGNVLTASGGVWVSAAPANPVAELDYAQITAPGTITGTSIGTATTILSGNAVTYSGTQRVRIEVFIPAITQATGGTSVVVNLYDNGTRSALMCNPIAPYSAPLYFVWYETPSAATHTFSVRAFSTAGTGTWQAGLPFGASAPPAFIRITKV